MRLLRINFYYLEGLVINLKTQSILDFLFSKIQVLKYWRSIEEGCASKSETFYSSFLCFIIGEEIPTPKVETQ